MTLVITFMIYGGTLLIVSGIEGSSLSCTFKWIINGAQGKLSDACPSGGTTPTTTPQTSTTLPGSVVYNGNPFAA